jgi:hypothetical protein
MVQILVVFKYTLSAFLSAGIASSVGLATADVVPNTKSVEALPQTYTFPLSETAAAAYELTLGAARATDRKVCAASTRGTTRTGSFTIFAEPVIAVPLPHAYRNLSVPIANEVLPLLTTVGNCEIGPGVPVPADAATPTVNLYTLALLSGFTIFIEALFLPAESGVYVTVATNCA